MKNMNLFLRMLSQLKFFRVPVIGVVLVFQCALFSASAWEDHIIDNGSSGQWIRIARNPVTGTFGVLACSVSSGKKPLYYYNGNADTWSKSFVTNVSQTTGSALAFDPATGDAYISYYDATNVVIVKSTPDGWSTPSLIATTGAMNGEGASSIAFDPSTGKPCVAFDMSDSTISYASSNSASWTTETIISGIFGFAQTPIKLLFDPVTTNACVAYAPSALTEAVYFDRRSNMGNWVRTSFPAGSFPSFYDFHYNTVTHRPGLLFGSSWDGSYKFAEFDGTAWRTNNFLAADKFAYAADGTPTVLTLLPTGITATGFGAQARFPGDTQFSAIDSLSYGASNWAGPLDCTSDGQNLCVAYSTVNTGLRFATTAIRRPGAIFRLETASKTNAVIYWGSLTSNNYAVYCSTNLLSGFTLLTNNIPGTPKGFALFVDPVQNVDRKFWKIIVEQ